jgi:hypothetical protein
MWGGWPRLGDQLRSRGDCLLRFESLLLPLSGVRLAVSVRAPGSVECRSLPASVRGLCACRSGTRPAWPLSIRRSTRTPGNQNCPPGPEPAGRVVTRTHSKWRREARSSFTRARRIGSRPWRAVFEALRARLAREPLPRKVEGLSSALITKSAGVELRIRECPRVVTQLAAIAAARFPISLGGTSSMWVATSQR